MTEQKHRFYYKVATGVLYKDGYLSMEYRSAIARKAFELRYIPGTITKCFARSAGICVFESLDAAKDWVRGWLVDHMTPNEFIWTAKPKLYTDMGLIVTFGSDSSSIAPRILPIFILKVKAIGEVKKAQLAGCYRYYTDARTHRDALAVLRGWRRNKCATSGPRGTHTCRAVRVVGPVYDPEPATNV